MNIQKSAQFICVAVGILRGHAAEISPVPWSPYCLVHHEGLTTQGERKISASHTMWLAQNVKTLWGIIVHQHGCGPGDDRVEPVAASDLLRQALARKHDCALQAPTYEQSDRELS